MNALEFKELLREAACAMDLGPFLLSSFSLLAVGVAIGFMLAVLIKR